MNVSLAREIRMTPALHRFPFQGTLCGRGAIALAWPEPDEFDAITELRNQDAVRRWFIDDRRLDPETNRKWLENIERPKDALLTVRLATNQRFLGMIGWSNWDRDNASICIGRLALDSKALKDLLRTANVKQSFALDAAKAVRDFVFRELEVNVITTWYIAGNELAARINSGIGMVETGRRTRKRPCGDELQTVELSLDREHWRTRHDSAQTWINQIS